MSIKAGIVAIAYVLTGSIVAQLVNEIVKEPYLDEIFHIPQAQRYCQGQFNEYDPKLTTPPGLYLISLTFEWIRKFIKFDKGSCNSVSNLRITALAGQLLLPWAIAMYNENKPPRLSDKDIKLRVGIPIISPIESLTASESDPSGASRRARQNVVLREQQVEAKRRRSRIVQRTIVDWQTTLDVHTIALLPPMWFFGFLYYTDLPSTVVVLFMLSAAKKGQHGVAAILSTLALLLRQTNIVWILFAIGISSLKRLSINGLSIDPSVGVLKQIISIKELKVEEIFKLISIHWPYLPVFAASTYFVYKNGSIVLGDKEFHQVSMHWSQPLYFIAFATFFAWPTLIASLPLRRNLWSIKRELIFVIIISIFALLAIHKGTIAHPFLLADNRHYSFYIWRRLIKRTKFSNYFLALPYAICIRLWTIVVLQKQSIFWLIGFITCTFAALCSSPLIEPRYFMIPYIILRTTLSPANVSSASVEAIWSILINIITIWLFLYKPFTWPDDSIQRFLW